MKIQIVCEGRVRSGLGHLLRARRFARALLETGRHQVDVISITDARLREVVSGLPCDVRHFEAADGVPGAIAHFDADVIVLDALALPAAVVDAASRVARLVVSLSPICSAPERMDLIVTRAPMAPPSLATEVLSGLQYAVFSDHVRRIDDDLYARSLGKPALPVAICMGGTDAPNKVQQVLGRLMRLPEECCFWVLLGEGYEHSYDALVREASEGGRHEIVLAKTSRTMWDVLEMCAVGVFAGGLTLLEAVYAGLPSVNVFERPEHVEIAAPELFARGAALSCGVLSEDALNCTASSIAQLHGDRVRLAAMRAAARDLIDDQGAARVIAAIERRARAAGAGETASW